MAKRTRSLFLLLAFVFATHGVEAGWSIQPSGTGANLHGVHFPVGPDVGYVVGDSGTILKTTNGGLTWSPLVSGSIENLYAVEFPTGAVIGYAVGANGTILKTADGGANWNPLVSGTSNDLFGLSFVDATKGFVVGRGGTILRTLDGVNWVTLVSGTAQDLHDVDFPVDAVTGFAVGAFGTIRRTTDGGNNWAGLPSGTTEILRGVDFPSDRLSGTIVGDSGTVLKSTDGATWALQDSGSLVRLNDVVFPSNPVTGFFVGALSNGQATIRNTVDGGLHWFAQTSNVGNELLAVHFPTVSIGYATGASGVILKTIDGGGAQVALHPTQAGSVTNFSSNVGACSTHTDCVNDQPANAGVGLPVANDGLVSYVSDGSGSTNRDMFRLDDGTVPASATVTSVEIRAAVAIGSGSAQALRLSYQRMGFDATPVDGSPVNPTLASFVTFSWFLPGLSWTPAELDALEIGLRHTAGGEIRVSQLYVVVMYQAPAVQVNYRSIGSAIGYGSGTVSATTGSPVVIGASTAWVTANRGRGDRIRIDGIDYTILSVDSETQLTLTSNFLGTTGSGKSHSITRKFVNLAFWEDCIDGPGGAGCEGVTSSSLVADHRSEVGIVYADGLHSAVDINGAITDATHTITLTADVGNRHNGLAGTGVILDNAGSSAPGVLVQDNFVTVEWIEIENGLAGVDGVRMNNIDPSNQIALRHLIVHNVPGDGVEVQDPDTNLDAYNNLVYEATNGMRISTSPAPNARARFLSNTVLNTTSGFVSTGASPRVLLVNNIAAGCSPNCFSVPSRDPASRNNLATDTTAVPHSPAGGGINSAGLAAIGFVSTGFGSENLHILPGSAAENLGADLSAIFNSDVDGANRVAPWDIGADEIATAFPFHTHYRSIGINGGTLAGGTGSAVAASSTVIFAAALPANVGAGDRLVLGSEVLYIVSQDSPTQVTLETPTTVAHSNDSFTITRAFTTLEAWESSRQGDLVAANHEEVGVVYNDGPLNAGLIFDGSVTDASRHMKLTVASGQRHNGTENAGANVNAADTVAGEIWIRDDHVLVEWLVLRRTRGAGAAAVKVDAKDVLLRNLIFANNEVGVQVVGAGGANVSIWNSVFHSNVREGILGNISSDSVTVRNCTLFANGGRGIEGSGGTFFSVTNTVSLGHPGDFGIPSGAQSYNMSSDASASGIGSLTGRAAVNQFVQDFAPFDLHLKSGSEAIEAGTSLASTFSDDIDTDLRPRGLRWDMGADEFGAGAGLSISSGANRTFVVGDPPQNATTITITDDQAVPTITATQDLRIRIPASFPMRWDPSVVSVSLAGSALLKVDAQIKALEDAGHTLVLDVLTNFVAGDQILVSSLKFFSFTSPAAADQLELEVGNDGNVSAVDDKTVDILSDSVPNLSSDNDQLFVVNPSPVLASPFTVSEGTTVSITALNDIRIRMPAGLNMTWDGSVLTAVVTGSGAGKVSTSVSYEDANRTLVIPVSVDFATGEFVTVSGLYFTAFAGVSPASRLELDVDGPAGGIIDLDDKTKTISVAADVPVFAATARDSQVVLQWVHPVGACVNVRIVRDDVAFPPWNLGFGTWIGDVPCGAAGTTGSTLDSTAANGTDYFYSAYVDHGPGYTNGKFVKARPFDTSTEVKWAYSTGATSMAPPGLRFSGAFSFVYVVSNDSILHSLTGGDPGGDWPPAFVPYKLGGPAQSRPPVVNFNVGGPNGAAFLGSQDGSVYAIDAVTGAKKWSQSIATMVQAAPAGHFAAYQAGAFDLILVGTRNGAGANSLVARDVHTGNPRWSFTNSAAQSGDNLEIGIISGGAAINYVANRAYFASRERSGGSSNTLWCVEFTAGTATLQWAQPLGNIDGSPILLNGRVYVGTTTGVVHAVDATSGVVEWSLALGDGAVKGFLFPRYGTNQLFLTTTGKIWSIEDNVTSGSVTAGWPITTIPSPSIPLYVPGTVNLLVGSGDGQLYQIDITAPASPKTVLLGTGSAAAGAPTLDLLKRMIYVGTDSGVIYSVVYPVP